MPELKPISAKKLLKVLSKMGFQVIRQKGSHAILAHPEGRRTTVPIHPTQEVGRGLLRQIINDICVSREEFLKRLEEC